MGESLVALTENAAASPIFAIVLFGWLTTCGEKRKLRGIEIWLLLTFAS